MKNTKKLTYGAMFLALALLLPQVFHLIGGPVTGSIFLPMHIPVILSGMILGYRYGLAIGIISPILSFLVMSMPQIPMLYLMLIELAVYGTIAGLLYYKKRINVFITLIITMLSGRLAKSILIWVAANLLNFKFPAPLATIPLLVTGIPGIIIQLILIPSVILLFERKFKFE